MCTRTLDQEREYLEGQLNSRFNFFLIFSSIISLAASRADSTDLKRLLLGLACFISLLFFIALARTHQLVFHVLSEILTDENHPYTKANASATIGNANFFIAYGVPFGITLFFMTWWLNV